MKFAPKSEKEIAEANLLQPGTYGFEIAKAEDKVSKSGNDMIELNLRVFNADGGFVFVRDFLMEALAYKLRHCAEACGLLAKYEAGELLASDFEGRTGYLKLKIDKDKNGQYADKNGVQDYLTEQPDHAKPISAHNAAKANGYVNDAASQGPLNDELPEWA